MNIKEALVRQSVEDKISIGDIVKKAYNGKFGEILRAYINGMITKEATYNQINPTDRSPLSADRVLGRIEAYNNILVDFERMIEEAELLQKPQPEQNEGGDIYGQEES